MGAVSSEAELCVVRNGNGGDTESNIFTSDKRELQGNLLY